MARKKKKNLRTPLLPDFNISEEIKSSVVGVLFIVLSIISILASWGKAGIVGNFLFKFTNNLLGIGYFLVPLILVVVGISFLRSQKLAYLTTTTIGSVLLFVSFLGTASLLFKNSNGGIIGGLISKPLLKLFDFSVSLIILVALMVISILLMLNSRLNWNSLMFWKKEDGEEDEEDGEDTDDEENEDEEEYEDEECEEEEEEENSKKKFSIAGVGKKLANKKETEETIQIQNPHTNREYTPPPISLLENDRGKPSVGDIKANANTIKRTLKNFGIVVEIDEVSVGPSVTRYAIKPAEGVKLSRIVGLKSDLSMALAAHPLRIEAPIPGRSLVGIEIPNKTKTIVGMAGLFLSKEYKESNKPLLLALGKDVAGKMFFGNLAKMPHILIAGATGSGKSVTIHTIIASLLYRVGPDNLRFIMVDPKRVELTLYNKIPHLLTPVITNPKKSILALKWAIKEMERRYNILESESVRDISSYHKNVVAPAFLDIKKKKGDIDESDASLPEPMPYIVIIIDELADIMSSYPREMEAAIIRLAQMSRAVGIHLILSTQRPSVNVITGLIKANVPARIALQVASQIDSRTILDSSGAETLLGCGDMLFVSGEMSKPLRVQSAFISETEVKKIAQSLAKQYEDEIPSEELNLSSENDTESLANSIENTKFDDDDDDLYEEAKRVVIEAGKASTSYLQRKLKVGYARAARLMDMLEERGIVGAQDGAKPREILDGNDSEGESFGKNLPDEMEAEETEDETDGDEESETEDGDEDEEEEEENEEETKNESEDEDDDNEDDDEKESSGGIDKSWYSNK